MNKIKIGYKDYDIDYRESDSTLLDDFDTCYGQIFYQLNKIIINSEFNEMIQKETLIHEVLHGIDDFYNVGLEEVQVQILAKAILTLLKDNNLSVK